MADESSTRIRYDVKCYSYCLHRIPYLGRLDAIETLRHRVHRLLVHQRETEEETVAGLVVEVAGGSELILAGGVADLERAELPVDLEVGLPVGVVDGGIVLL